MAEEARKRPSVLKKIALSAMSLLFCLAIFGLGELYCRYFLDINLRKTNRDFVATDVNGQIIGNAKNANGISFGTLVLSDENGFRVPPEHNARPGSDAVLFLGDSVTFGVGIPEPQTFVGRFRAAHPQIETYNSGVVSYGIADYKRVATEFLPRHHEVKQVYLFYCLNDFHLERSTNAVKPEDVSLTRRLKRAVASIFVNMNEFLGPRSKLYVYITGITIDPSRRYFEWDLSLMNVPDDRFSQTLDPIVEIGRLARDQNAEFTVFLNPYELQVRDGQNANFSPQDRIAAYLRENGIRVVDTRTKFTGLARSSDAFLFADPMHLNEKGHQLVFGALEEVWASSAGVQAK